MDPNPFTPPPSPYVGESIVFDTEDANAMHRHSLITPPSSNGMVRVSKRRLRESPSTTDSDIASTQPLPSDDMVEVPFLEDSAAFFYWIGFTSTTASDLWNYWSTRRPHQPNGFNDLLHVANDHIKWFNGNAGGLQDDWIGVMNAMGINQSLRDCIMDPKFDSIRTSESLKFWLTDTFNMRQRALDGIKAKSSERQREREKAEGKGKSKESKPFHGSSTKDLSHSQISSWTAEPQALPGHLMLWRGLDLKRTDGLLDNNGDLLNFNCMVSSAPTDFSGSTSLWYFTVSKEVAETYAQWALKRLEGKEGNVCLVSMQVPDTLISSLNKFELYYPSEQWKKVIWYSRRSHTYPEELFHLDRAEYLVGHIAGNTDREISKLASWQDLSRDHVLFVPSTSIQATQQVFTPAAYYKLSKACKKTVSVHRSRFSK